MVRNKLSEKEIKDLENESLQYYDSLHRLGFVELDFVQEAADDCVQNTYLDFEKAIKIRSYPINKCENWLYKVLYDNIKKILKLKISIRNYQVSIDSDMEEKEEKRHIRKQCYLADMVNIAIDYEKIEREKSLISKLNELTDKERSLVFDVYYKNKRLKDISKENGETIDCIKKRHRHIKTVLSNALNNGGDVK